MLTRKLCFQQQQTLVVVVVSLVSSQITTVYFCLQTESNELMRKCTECKYGRPRRAECGADIPA